MFLVEAEARHGVFRAEETSADEKVPETHAMDRWIALGIFLLGTGVGALTTVALYAEQIRHLKQVRDAAYQTIPDSLAQ